MQVGQNEPGNYPTMPDQGAATSEEVFKCWNCGSEYPTEGQPEGTCPVCSQICTHGRCQVSFASNEGY